MCAHLYLLQHLSTNTQVSTGGPSFSLPVIYDRLKTYSLDLLDSLLLVVTFLNCWTRGLSSLPGFSLCLLDLFLRPACGAVCERPRPGGGALPRRRYSSSTSPRWWACSSEISLRCLRGWNEECDKITKNIYLNLHQKVKGPILNRGLWSSGCKN